MPELRCTREGFDSQRLFHPQQHGVHALLHNIHQLALKTWPRAKVCLHESERKTDIAVFGLQVAEVEIVETILSPSKPPMRSQMNS